MSQGSRWDLENDHDRPTDTGWGNEEPPKPLKEMSFLVHGKSHREWRSSNFLEGLGCHPLGQVFEVFLSETYSA